MSKNYQRIGNYISVIDNRNTDGSITNLMGISIDKCYIPSVANVIGTDLRNYKLIRKGQFACSLMQVSRDQKIPLAMYTSDQPAIMSPAYVLFEVNRLDELLPEYLELWFKRAEFDREASFYAVGGVRGSLDWEDFCNMKLPIPSIDEQRMIVYNYRVITDRITLLKKMNCALEEMASTIYKNAVIDKDENDVESVYAILNVINGAPYSSELFNTEQRGYPLIRIRDLSDCNPQIYTDEKLNNTEYVRCGDILIGMDGEFIPHVWFGKVGVLNQRVCKVVPASDYIHPLYLYWTLKPILAEIQRTQGGTTVIHIGKKDFDKMRVFNLTETEHLSFKHTVTPIFSQMLNNSQEILKLTHFQNMLLLNMSC